MNRTFSNLVKQMKTSISVQQRFYAAAPKGTTAFAGGKLGGGLSKKGGVQQVKKLVLPVETDTTKLAAYCCGLNIYKTGGEEVKLKPDSEYPEWLFNLKVDGKGPSLEEMDPTTLEYWSRKRRVELRHKNKMSKNRFPEPFIPKSVKNLRLA